MKEMGAADSMADEEAVRASPDGTASDQLKNMELVAAVTLPWDRRPWERIPRRRQKRKWRGCRKRRPRNPLRKRQFSHSGPDCAQDCGPESESRAQAFQREIGARQARQQAQKSRGCGRPPPQSDGCLDGARAHLPPQRRCSRLLRIPRRLGRPRPSRRSSFRRGSLRNSTRDVRRVGSPVCLLQHPWQRVPPAPMLVNLLIGHRGANGDVQSFGSKASLHALLDCAETVAGVDSREVS